MHIAARGGAADGCVVHASSWKAGASRAPRGTLDSWRAVVPGHTKVPAPLSGDPERLRAQALGMGELVAAGALLLLDDSVRPLGIWDGRRMSAGGVRSTKQLHQAQGPPSPQVSHAAAAPAFRDHSRSMLMRMSSTGVMGPHPAHSAAAATSGSLHLRPKADADPLLHADDWTPVDSSRSLGLATTRPTGEAGASPAPSPSEALAAALKASTEKSRNKALLSPGTRRRRGGGGGTASHDADAVAAATGVRYTDARRLASALSFMGTLAPDGDGLPHVGPRRGSAVSALGAPPDALLHPHASTTESLNASKRLAQVARVKKILEVQASVGAARRAAPVLTAITLAAPCAAAVLNWPRALPG